MDKNKFGIFVKEKRLQKGYTQKNLADLLMIDVTAVSKWERGVSFPDITLIPDLCKHLGVNEHELIESSNDTKYWETVRQANQYKKIKDFIFYFFSVSYFVTVITCFIVNIAVSHTLSWFFIVLASCLCGFTFVPTVTRFFSKFKFTLFLLTTFLSLSLLFTVCGIYTENHWEFIAISGTLLFYFAVFYPVFFYKQKAYIKEEQFKKVSKIFMITYSLGLLILTLLLIGTVFLYKKENFSLTALLITAYSFAGIVVYGIVELLPLNRLFKLAVDSFATGLHLFGLNGVFNKLLGDNGIDFYRINFTDWKNCSNGNIAIIVLVSSIVLGIVFTLFGIVKKNKKT